MRQFCFRGIIKWLKHPYNYTNMEQEYARIEEIKKLSRNITTIVECEEPDRVRMMAKSKRIELYLALKRAGDLLVRYGNKNRIE